MAFVLEALSSVVTTCIWGVYGFDATLTKLLIALNPSS